VSDALRGRAADSRLGHTTGVVVRAGAARVDSLRLGDHTLAERVALLLAEICEDVRRVDGTSRSKGGGEIAAVVAALDVAETDHVLVLSADRPLLSPDLVIGLAGLPDADAAIPRDDLGPHLLCARYRRTTALPVLRAALEAGSADTGSMLRGLEVGWLEGESLRVLDPAGVALTRVGDASELDAVASRHPECVRGAWRGHPGLGLARGPA
jgi:molybdopterin-guanine dinucleotide biosynthesis protein A